MAIRNLGIDIGFDADLSAITRIDSQVDGVVQSVTGGMGRAENSVNGLGSEFSGLASDVSGSMSRVGGDIDGLGSEATSAIGDVDRLGSSFNGVANESSSAMGRASSNISGMGSDAVSSVGDIGRIGSAFSGVASSASSAMSRVGGDISSMGSDATSGASDVGRLDSSIRGLANSSSGLNSVTQNIRNIGDEAERSAKKTDGLASKLGGGIKAGLAGVGIAAAGAVAGFLAIGEASQETMEDMGKLETAFTTSGFSAEAGMNSYKGLVGVLGETDQAVETANHLAKLTDNEQDLATWTDICTGVYATFGDSLPIEGLTEAA